MFWAADRTAPTNFALLEVLPGGKSGGLAGGAYGQLMSVTMLLIGAGALWAALMALRLVKAFKTAGRLVRLWIAVAALGAAVLLAGACLLAGPALADSIGAARYGLWMLSGVLVWLGVRCGVRPLFAAG